MEEANIKIKFYYLDVLFYHKNKKLVKNINNKTIIIYKKNYNYRDINNLCKM